MNNVLNKFFNNEYCETPIWFLRQAGRHIPEYFKIREQATDFVEFCLNPKLIVESTKLPLNYYL